MRRWLLLAVTPLVLTAAVSLARSHGASRPQAPAAVLPQPDQPRPPVRQTTTGKLITTADWFDNIFRDLRRDRGDREERPWRDPFSDDDPEPRRSSGGGGYYRTMCVRLCDGFPFPISFSTARSNFAKDTRRCAERCPGARLFVYRNPGESMEDMSDLDGQAYRQLPTAFLHQSRYVPNCTCRGNPWDQEALARHKAYAEEASGKKQLTQRAEGARSPKAEARPARASRWVQRQTDRSSEDR